jgi:hypothetical protein
MDERLITHHESRFTHLPWDNEKGRQEGGVMAKRRAALLICVVLLLFTFLACKSSTALMTNDQIMNHVVLATPWP